MGDDQEKREQAKDPISTEVDTFKTSVSTAAQRRKDVQEALRRAYPAQAKAVEYLDRRWLFHR